MKPIFFITKLRIVFIGFLLVAFTIGGFILFSRELRKRSKAAPAGTPILFFTPVNSPPMQDDRSIKIAVRLDPNGLVEQLFSFDVEVKFDTSKIELVNASNLEANVALAPDALKQKVELIGSDTIHLVGTKTSPFTPANQQVADISFKMKTGSSFPVEFTWGGATLQTTNFVKVPLALASNSVGNSSVSTAAKEVVLSFSAPKPDYQVGEKVSIDVMLTTNGQQIGSTGLVFSYDPGILTYESTTVVSATFDQAAIAPPPEGADISINAERKTAISGNLKVATVKFTAKASGSVDLKFAQDRSTVYTFGTTQNVLTKVLPLTITVGAPQSSSSSQYLGNAVPVPTGEKVDSNGDLLNINATTFDQAPIRYQQAVTDLDRGDYVLSGSVIVYTSRGRGVLITMACGESDCGDGKKLNDIMGKTPIFSLSTAFERQEAVIHLTDNQRNKKYFVRIFVEDGSEADFDYVSLTDIWGGEQLKNSHFESTTKMSSPRKFPDYWETDVAGSIYGTIDPKKGKDGALYINSSSRQ